MILVAIGSEIFQFIFSSPRSMTFVKTSNENRSSAKEIFEMSENISRIDFPS